MYASEFNERKNILYRYFKHPRWNDKCDDSEWDVKYYKGRKNLEELRLALNIVFGSEDITIIEARNFKNNDGEIIGGTIICSFYIAANFNGFWQGEGSSYIYVAFTLARHGYFYTQSSSLDYLKEQIDK